MENYKLLIKENIIDTLKFIHDFISEMKESNFAIPFYRDDKYPQIYEEYISNILSYFFNYKNVSTLSECRIDFKDIKKDVETFPIVLDKKMNIAEIDFISKYKDDFIKTEIKLDNKFIYSRHKHDIARLCFLLKIYRDKISWCNFIIFDLKNINDFSEIKEEDISILEKEEDEFTLQDETKFKDEIKELNNKKTKIQVLIIKKSNESYIYNDLDKLLFNEKIKSECSKVIENSVDNLKYFFRNLEKEKRKFEDLEEKFNKSIERESLLKDKMKKWNEIFAPNVLTSDILSKIFNEDLNDKILDNKVEINLKKYEEDAKIFFKKIEDFKEKGVYIQKTKRSEIISILIRIFILNESEDQIFYENEISEEIKNTPNNYEKQINELGFNYIFLKKIFKNDDYEDIFKKMAEFSSYILIKIKKHNNIYSKIIEKWHKIIDFEINKIFIQQFSYFYILNIDYDDLENNNNEFPNLDDDMKNCKTIIKEIKSKINYFKHSGLKLRLNIEKNNHNDSEDKFKKSTIPSLFFYYKLKNSENFIKHIAKMIKSDSDDLRDYLKKSILKNSNYDFLDNKFEEIDFLENKFK